MINEPGDIQFIDIKRSGMSKIKNQRVPERFGPKVEGFIPGQVVIQLFIQIEGLMKVVQYLLPLFRFASFTQNYCTTFFHIHGLFLIGKLMSDS
jgi:hypothetical protein